MTENAAPQAAVEIERRLAAPIGLVWQMWTDPEHFKAWYGPGGVTIPVARMEVRVGGKRLVCMEMQTPDGPMQMWFTGEYLEVVEPEHHVYTECMSDEHGTVLSTSEARMPAGHPVTTEVRVDLESMADGTRMTMTHAGVPVDSPGGPWPSTSSPATSRCRSTDSRRPSSSDGRRRSCPLECRAAPAGQSTGWCKYEYLRVRLSGAPHESPAAIRR